MTSRPRLERDPVGIPVLAGPLAVVWDTLCVLAGALEGVPWAVVGGQMVFLHAAEHGVEVHRVSADIDAAVDLRADPEGITKLIAVLGDLGFVSSGESPEGHAHRFEKQTAAGVAVVDVAVDADDADDVPLVVDVLAPEGLGERTDLRTAGSGTAFPAPGVTQALRRTELVPLRYGTQVSWIPRPSLLGAIVGKAVAATVDHIDPQRHLTDLAFLCGLVPDPFALAGQVTKKDRERLRAAATRLGPDHGAWDSARSSINARIALETLIGN